MMKTTDIGKAVYFSDTKGGAMVELAVPNPRTALFALESVAEMHDLTLDVARRGLVTYVTAYTPTRYARWTIRLIEG